MLPPPGRQTLVNQRRASSEVDIDGGMSESEPTNETSRVAQSDEIVKQLEKSVPRWDGFGPGGWSTSIQLVCSSVLYPSKYCLTRSSRPTLCRLLGKYEIIRTQGTRQRSLTQSLTIPTRPTVERDSAQYWTLSQKWIQSKTFPKS